MVAAAATGDGPTTYEWSTILLTTNVRLYQSFDGILKYGHATYDEGNIMVNGATNETHLYISYNITHITMLKVYFGDEIISRFYEH